MSNKDELITVKLGAPEEQNTWNTEDYDVMGVDLSKGTLTLKKKEMQIDTTFEKNKLKSLLSKQLYNLLKKHELIIAGGTITSLFTGNEINDLDIYGRCNSDVYSFAKSAIEDGSWVISHTHKATMFNYKDSPVPLQLIHYQCFKDIDELFNSFDFTVCMGAYDFKTEEFIFHPDFLKHNSQRILKFNSGTDFPIVSALRAQKYEDKGYKISKTEFIRAIMTCMNLDINSYEELKEHLGGLYGISFDRLFEDVEDEEFDMQTAINKLSDITKEEDYFTVPDLLDISIEEVLEDIDKSQKVCFEHRDEMYRLMGNREIVKMASKQEPDSIITVDEAIKFDKLYKFVKKTSNGEYRSFYENSFEYPIGETVEAKEALSQWGGGKLYFNLKEDIKSSTYFDSRDAVLIEVGFNVEDLVDIETDNSITVTRCKMLREVPEDEWKQWIEE